MALLDDLARYITTELDGTPCDAERIAERVVDRVRRDHGGVRTWIPSTVSEGRILDGLQQGRRPAEVARELGVHVSTVYRTYRRRRVRSSGV